MIAYIGGILTVTLLPSLANVLLLLPLLLLLYFSRPRHSVLLYLCGLTVAATWGAWQLHHRLPASSGAFDLHVSGRVEGLVQRSDDRQTFDLVLLTVDSHEPAHLRLRRIRLSSYHSEVEFSPGDLLDAIVRLRSPRGLYNPAASDTERYYLAESVDARAYLRELMRHTPGHPPDIDLIRLQIGNWLQARFQPQTAATLRALVTGDRMGLDDRHWEWLRRTGTAHLLVVSGLHIAVMATLGWILGRLIAIPLHLAGRGKRGRWLPPIMGLLLATLYAAMAGWGLPVQRAWLMLLVFLLGNIQLLNLTGWQRWKLALVVILTLQPLAILEPGLWLSFAAVALILWQMQQRRFHAYRYAWMRLPGEWGRLQLALFLGLSLVLIITFNQVSPLGIAINLIAVPWVSLLIWLLPSLLLASAWWSYAAGFIEWNFDRIWSLLEWASQTPGLVLQVGTPEPLLLALACIGILVMLLPLPAGLRSVALLLYLPVLLTPVALPIPGQFRGWVFDVGQGQAMLIETAEGRVLYDTGPGFGDGRSAFSYTLAPYLRSQGVTALERVLVSHADSDHSGGFEALRNRYDIGVLSGGMALPDVDVKACREGSWKMGGVVFTLLNPFHSHVGLDRNDRSCVLRISNGQCSLLVTGDLSQSGEYRLLSAGKIEPVTWLMAGHHGSRDSMAGALLDHAAPDHVLISAGYGNRFGHPHAEVIERLAARKIDWSSTAEHGALLLQATSDSCQVMRYRELKKRYWTGG